MKELNNGFLVHMMCEDGDLHDINTGQCIGKFYFRHETELGKFLHECEYCKRQETFDVKYPRPASSEEFDVARGKPNPFGDEIPRWTLIYRLEIPGSPWWADVKEFHDDYVTAQTRYNSLEHPTVLRPYSYRVDYSHHVRSHRTYRVRSDSKSDTQGTPGEA